LPPQRATLVLGRTQDVSEWFSCFYTHISNPSLEPGPLQEAAKYGIPLLLIHGEADLQVDPQAVLDNAVTPFFTNAEVHHLKGVGHAPFYEAEKDIAGFILEFTSRISLARREEGAL